MALKLNGVTITVNKLNGNNIWVEYLNDVVVYDARPPLSEPQGSLIDKFDYSEGASWNGGVMLIAIYNSNTEPVILRGRILGGGWDFTSNFIHFVFADGYFFGDTFPPSTGLEYGLNVMSGGLMTYEWLYPVTVEVWFEPASSSSSYSTSNKLIITIGSLKFAWIGTYSSNQGTQDFTLPAIPDPYTNANQYYDANNYAEGDIIMVPDSDNSDYVYFEVIS